VRDFNEHPEKTSHSSRLNFEFGSNVIADNDLQFPKQRGPINSTVFGIKIEVTEEPLKHSEQIRVKRESASKLIIDSDLQLKNARERKTLTLFGIVIDFSAEDKKLPTASSASGHGPFWGN